MSGAGRLAGRPAQNTGGGVVELDQFEQRIEEDGLYVLQRTGATQLLRLGQDDVMTVPSGFWTKVPEYTLIQWDAEDLS
jgi:hypothetical protein